MSEEDLDDLVHYRVEDQIAIISLNRPRKQMRSAMSWSSP